jgi:hypothetical protein
VLTAYYIAAYSSTKWVLVIRKNLPKWDVLQDLSGGGALRLPCSWSRLLQSVSLADYTSPVGRQQGVIIWRFSCTQHNSSKNALPA